MASISCSRWEPIRTGTTPCGQVNAAGSKDLDMTDMTAAQRQARGQERNGQQIVGRARSYPPRHSRSRATASPRRLTRSFSRISCIWFLTVAELIAS